jgi:hypothetical protein
MSPYIAPDFPFCSRRYFFRVRPVCPSQVPPRYVLTLKVEQAFAAIGRSETFQRALLMLHDAQIQVAGDANVKRACMAAENVDVAAGPSKMPAVLVVGPRERSWRARQVRASVVEKVRTYG